MLMQKPCGRVAGTKAARFEASQINWIHPGRDLNRGGDLTGAGPGRARI